MTHMRRWRYITMMLGVLSATAAVAAGPAWAASAPGGPARARDGAKPAKHKPKRPKVRCHTVRRGHKKVKVCKKVTPPKRKPGGSKGGTAPVSSGKVLFDSGGNLFAVDGQGRGRRQLTQGGSPSGSTEYIEPSLSADGSRLVFQGPDSQAYTANGDAQNMKPLTNGSMPTMNPRIAPDGRQVMWVTTFLLYAGAEITNTIQSYDGSGTAQNYSQTIGMAGFAPHGEYVCNNGAVNTITIAAAAQIAANQCSDIVASDAADANARFGVRPAFSPDGRYVVDSISEDGGQTTTGLYLYNVATGQLVRRLTSGNDDLPVFSPDGTKILFNHGNDIDEVPTAGGAATRFAANASDPTWSR